MLGLVYLINLLALIFMMSNNPMSLVLTIIFTTLVVCFLMHSLFLTSWFSYILFLIFLGGLMVLFIYMCSVASNEYIKLNLTKKNIFILLVVTLVIILLTEPLKEMNLNSFVLVSKMYFANVSFIIGFSIIYLLLTLFVCVAISKSKYGPIRSKKI